MVPDPSAVKSVPEFSKAEFLTNLVDNQQIGLEEYVSEKQCIRSICTHLRDTGSPLSRDFVAATDVDLMTKGQR
jgi:hypothetical protein